MKTLIKVLLIPAIALAISACGGSGPSDNGSVDSGSGSSSSSSGLASSSGGAGEQTAIEKGRAIYEQTLGGSRFACADCHSLQNDSANSAMRVGHPIADAPRRASFKNGGVASMVDAANSCLDEWMRTSVVWSNTSQDYLDLVEFLASEDDGALADPTINYSIVDPASAQALQGDAAAGQLAFNDTCAYCHGTDAILGDNTRGVTIAGNTNTQFVIAKARTSGSAESAVYSGLTGGVMPFWSAERMDDQTLADVAAFLATTEREDLGSGGGSQGGGNCASTHSKIGQQAILNTQQHGVSGTAVVVDDCTIEIQNFNFDGGGLNVRIYAGVDGNYLSMGTALTGDNLVRNQAYVNETIRVTLPEGLSLDDFNGVSVWCVPFGLSFGSGLFM